MDRRIAGYDFARSLAVFGLVAANFSLGFEIADFRLDHLIQARLHSLMQGGAIATFLVLGWSRYIPPDTSGPNNKRDPRNHR